MSHVTITKQIGDGLAGLQRQSVPLWAWWLAAIAAFSASNLALKWTALTTTLNGPDDAARLVRVRELMAGAPWYEARSTAMGGDAGHLFHWSRLVDAPLAVLQELLMIVMPAAQAELAMRGIWPILVLAALMWVIARSLDRVHARLAALIGLAFSITSLLAVSQFSPGRIDHHNVMIAAMLSAILLPWTDPYARRNWAFAGALAAFAVAVGYEALAPAAVLCVFVLAAGLASPGMAGGARDFLMAFAVMLAALLAVSISPGQWLVGTCDAISLNLVVLAAAGAAGAVLALGPGRQWGLVARLAVIAAGGAIGLAGFGLLEPACLAGPLGQVPAALKPVWLDRVSEGRSVLRDVVDGSSYASILIPGYFAAAVAAQWALWRRSARGADGLLLAALIAVAALACWQNKFLAYASLLCAVPLAAWCASLPAWRGVQPTVVRLCAALLASQPVMIAMPVVYEGKLRAMLGTQTTEARAASGATSFSGAPSLSGATGAIDPACFAIAPVSTLQALPKGLIAAHIDLGPFIAAISHHRALAGPYHRLPDAILAVRDILDADDDTRAATALARWNVDYVAVCTIGSGDAASGARGATTLQSRLLNGRPPAFLIPTALAATSAPFKVWRVERGRLGAEQGGGAPHTTGARGH